MNLHFSNAQEADIPAVFALYRSMIGTANNTWDDSYPTADLVLQDVHTQSLYVLKDDQGHILAAAAAGAVDELSDLIWDIENPCELARVAVAVPLQSQGIGSHLLKQVMTAVKARGFDGICLLVSIHHPHAVALYEKNGFNRCGAVNRYAIDFYMYQLAFELARSHG